MPLSDKMIVETQARIHMNLAKEWEEILQTFSTLLENLPDYGPIVVINVGAHQSDAVALLDGCNAAAHIVLPCFSSEKVRQHRSNMDTHLQAHGLRMLPAPRPFRPKGQPGADAMRNVLRGLWVDLVKPIIDCLGILKMDRPQGRPLPRIWWCPTGDLVFLPIHAAGIYSGSEADNILNYAVSSYTPNLSAIASRVANCQSIDEAVSGLFLTDHPKGLVSSPISGTTDEVHSIYTKATAHGIRAIKIGGSDITVNAFLERLDEYSSIHVACHAIQHESEPLLSKFIFHNGTLDLATIMGRNLKNADLAFLSACQTGTRDRKLSDEAIHLAAGMLAAGYRRVVASMWSIRDRTAQNVANEFYEYLWKHRADKSTHIALMGPLPLMPFTTQSSS